MACTWNDCLDFMRFLQNQAKNRGCFQLFFYLACICVPNILVAYGIDILQNFATTSAPTLFHAWPIMPIFSVADPEAEVVQAYGLPREA